MIEYKAGDRIGFFDETKIAAIHRGTSGNFDHTVWIEIPGIPKLKHGPFETIDEADREARRLAEACTHAVPVTMTTELFAEPCERGMVQAETMALDLPDFHTSNTYTRYSWDPNGCGLWIYRSPDSSRLITGFDPNMAVTGPHDWDCGWYISLPMVGDPHALRFASKEEAAAFAAWFEEVSLHPWERTGAFVQQDLGRKPDWEIVMARAGDVFVDDPRLPSWILGAGARWFVPWADNPCVYNRERGNLYIPPVYGPSELRPVVSKFWDADLVSVAVDDNGAPLVRFSSGDAHVDIQGLYKADAERLVATIRQAVTEAVRRD